MENNLTKPQRLSLADLEKTAKDTTGIECNDPTCGCHEERDDDDEIYEISQLLGRWPTTSMRKFKGGKIKEDHFLVDWKGFSKEHICWVPEADLAEDELRDAFMDKYVGPTFLYHAQFVLEEGRLIVWTADRKRIEDLTRNGFAESSSQNKKPKPKKTPPKQQTNARRTKRPPVERPSYTEEQDSEEEVALAKKRKSPIKQTPAPPSRTSSRSVVDLTLSDDETPEKTRKPKAAQKRPKNKKNKVVEQTEDDDTGFHVVLHNDDNKEEEQRNKQDEITKQLEEEKLKIEEAKQKLKEEREKRLQEEAEAKQKLEEEAAKLASEKQRLEEETALLRKKFEEELAAQRKKAEEEIAEKRKQIEEEATALKKPSKRGRKKKKTEEPKENDSPVSDAAQHLLESLEITEENESAARTRQFTKLTTKQTKIPPAASFDQEVFVSAAQSETPISSLAIDRRESVKGQKLWEQVCGELGLTVI